MVQNDPTANMGQRSLCLNPCNGFSGHSEWMPNSIQYVVSSALRHLSDLTPLSPPLLSPLPLYFLLGYVLPCTPTAHTLTSSRSLHLLREACSAHPRVWRITAPNLVFSIPLPLVLIILDILCICFLSVFSTEMSSLWRQELGFAHCSTPSHDTQLLLKCLLNERRNFFMGSFALAGHQCLSEEKTLWELVRGNLYEGILRRKWLLVSTAMKKWFQGLATEYKLFKREDH